MLGIASLSVRLYLETCFRSSLTFSEVLSPATIKHTTFELTLRHNYVVRDLRQLRNGGVVQFVSDYI